MFSAKTLKSTEIRIQFYFSLKIFFQLGTTFYIALLSLIVLLIIKFVIPSPWLYLLLYLFIYHFWKVCFTVYWIYIFFSFYCTIFLFFLSDFIKFIVRSLEIFKASKLFWRDLIMVGNLCYLHKCYSRCWMGCYIKPNIYNADHPIFEWYATFGKEFRWTIQGVSVF